MAYAGYPTHGVPAHVSSLLIPRLPYLCSQASAAKKKKKKKGGGGGGGGGSNQAGGGGAAQQPAEDAQARFQSTLDELKSGDAALLTTCDLSQCGFGDKKLRQLLAALRDLKSVCALTSLDLSNNSISDAGATALCAALASEGEALAPQLGALALHGNPIGAEAASTCAAALAVRPGLALVLPEQSSPEGGGGSASSLAAPDLDVYFAARATGEESGSEASGKEGGKANGGEEEEELPLLVGPTYSLDVATAILEKATPATAGESSDVTDAVQSLLWKVEAECAQLAASGTQNAKFLPRGLKWCSQHTASIGALLSPPARPRVSYGAGGGSTSAVMHTAWASRLGRRRLLLIELLICLINARRPPLTSALADSKPSLVCLALSLLERHPVSAVLGAAIRRLVDAAFQAKPLRASMLTAFHAPPPSSAAGGGADALVASTVPSAQSMVANALLGACRPNGGGSGRRHAMPSTPVWLELASELEKLGASDKQVNERLNYCKEWGVLVATLPEFQKLEPPARWACGDPPEKEGARAIGAGSEMGELLRLLQGSRM